MIYLQTQQSVFPKTIYIGDRAELKCQFKTEHDAASLSFSGSHFVLPPDSNEYDIVDVSVQPAGNGMCNLVISFIPWHTGQIQLPDYELCAAPLDSSGEETTIGTIHFEGVNILSLVEQQGVTELKTFSSPLLLPGTIYKIYGVIAGFAVFLFILIRLIVKRNAVIFWLKNKRLRRRYAKNKKTAIKELKALTNSTDDSQAATAIQNIMRSYLEFRLSYPFTKTLTSEMSLAFENATAGLADENRQTAFEDIISIFTRTDYIRFSNSQNAFTAGELAGLINRLIDDILVIEEEKHD